MGAATGATDPLILLLEVCTVRSTTDPRFEALTARLAHRPVTTSRSPATTSPACSTPPATPPPSSAGARARGSARPGVWAARLAVAGGRGRGRWGRWCRPPAPPQPTSPAGSASRPADGLEGALTGP